MFMTIVNAIAAIPELIKTAKELISFIQDLQRSRYFEKSAVVYDFLASAQTSEDRAKAAKQLQDLLGAKE